MEPRLSRAPLAAACLALGALAWGCEQLVGADFDKPFQTTTASSSGSGGSSGGAGGQGGSPAVSSASSSGAGGGAGGSTSTASASSTSTSTGAATSSASSTGTGNLCGQACYDAPGLTPQNMNVGICKAGAVDCNTFQCVAAVGPAPDDTACGPLSGDGDENCDGVVGFNSASSCTLQAFTSVLHSAGCAAANVTDIQMSTGAPIFNYDAVASFHVFAAQQSGTVPVYLCLDTNTMGHTISVNIDCPALGGGAYVADGTGLLGYVAKQQAKGYQPLYYLHQGMFNVVLIPASAMATKCCFSVNGMCEPAGVFAPP